MSKAAREEMKLEALRCMKPLNGGMDTIKNYSEPTVLFTVIGSSQLELNYARNVLNTDWSMNLFFCGNRKSISEHKQVFTKILDSFPTLEIVIVLITSDEKDILKHGLILSRIAKNRGLISVVVSQETMESVISREQLKTYTDSLLLCPSRKRHENWLLRHLGKNWIQKKDIYQYAKEFLHAIQRVEAITGFINLDSADIYSTLKNSGNSYCWEGSAEQGNTSAWFNRMLTQSGRLKERITTAERVLLWIAAPLDCSLAEIENVVRPVSDHFSPNTSILFGAVFDKELSGKLCIIALITEFHP